MTEYNHIDQVVSGFIAEAQALVAKKRLVGYSKGFEDSLEILADRKAMAARNADAVAEAKKSGIELTLETDKKAAIVVPSHIVVLEKFVSLQNELNTSLTALETKLDEMKAGDIEVVSTADDVSDAQDAPKQILTTAQVKSIYADLKALRSKLQLISTVKANVDAAFGVVIGQEMAASSDRAGLDFMKSFIADETSVDQYNEVSAKLKAVMNDTQFGVMYYSVAYIKESLIALKDAIVSGVSSSVSFVVAIPSKVSSSASYVKEWVMPSVKETLEQSDERQVSSNEIASQDGAQLEVETVVRSRSASESSKKSDEVLDLLDDESKDNDSSTFVPAV